MGGQTYNKKTQKFENIGVVYEFDPISDRLKACKDLSATERFTMGMVTSDGAKQVAALGEKALHLFDGVNWKTVPKEFE